MAAIASGINVPRGPIVHVDAPLPGHGPKINPLAERAAAAKATSRTSTSSSSSSSSSRRVRDIAPEERKNPFLTKAFLERLRGIASRRQRISKQLGIETKAIQRALSNGERLPKSTGDEVRVAPRKRLEPLNIMVLSAPGVGRSTLLGHLLFLHGRITRKNKANFDHAPRVSSKIHRFDTNTKRVTFIVRLIHVLALRFCHFS
jgi:hypothetical protein